MSTKETSSGDVYQVSSIVGHKVKKGKTFYKVHWLGYTSKDDTWEPIENLTNCTKLIQWYMDEKAAENRRKSLRSRTVRDFSSDDEPEDTSHSTKTVTVRRSRTRSPKATKTTRVSVTPAKKTTQVDTSISRRYKLRSADFSSEDEITDMTTKSSKMSRMSLSESRFIKQLDNIKKGKYSSSPKKTSTPNSSPPKQQPRTESPSKVQATKRLVFNNSRTSSVARPPTMMTRLRQHKISEDITVAEAPMTVAEAPVTMAEAEDDEYTPPPKEEVEFHKSYEEIPREVPTEEQQCFPVTWKEFGLAAFVTGVAALGYVCYVSDICGYC